MTFKTIILVLLISNNLIAQSSIKEKLNKIEGIKVSEIYAEEGFSKCFKIFIKQPIDHSDTTQGFFYQKIYLSHKSVDKPMVMSINGYDSYSNQISDWTTVLDANQIFIEHRYFGESRPDTMDYEYLNISNTAKDLHRIIEIFSEIYKKGWMSVGHSKGGLTALSYRYFFPDDVDATIALSTSVKTTKCDSSFFHYIDSLNATQGCNKELEAFQELLLTRKKEIVPHLEDYLKMAGKEFSQLGLTTIYEIAVLEIPFSIWQNGTGCSSIDYSLTDPKELFNEMKSSLHGWFLTDEVFERIDPYHYQALTEFGYYCYPVTRFSKLLETGFEKLTPVQPISGVNTSYSNKPMTQIKAWAESEGNQIIYISGGNDPYAKQRVIPNSSLDALSLLLEDRNHNQVFSSNLDSDTLNRITELISKWMKD
ncbi:MAG: S28 family serine protease [Brumimicrobium sp.]